MTGIRKPRSVRQRRILSSASASLVVEIGTEELPWQFIPPALASLAESAERSLKEQRLTFSAVRTFGTPRRLVLVVESLSKRQAPAVKEAMGPSRAVAFDPGGRATKAAIGFAASQGVPVEKLEIRHTPKGEYVFAVKQDSGRPATSILSESIPALVHGLTFPKSMRWNQSGMRFARPIRWLLTLYGDQVVPVDVGGVTASNRTWGHRFLGSGKSRPGREVTVANATSYFRELERHGVVVDHERRRRMIVKQLDSLSKSARGFLQRDEDLLEQAIFTVEYPSAILGAFNPTYLSLPKEILVTAMKEHQGYFSLTRRTGELLPQFIAVTNMKCANTRLIREGNERVLAARLADAQFFFDEDRKVSLSQRVERLKHVTFHRKLGTLYQKTERIMALAARLAEELGESNLVNACRRAAEVSKADLLTGVVGEFPALQGMMGGEYARHDGEPEDVCQAVAEQYLPRAMDGELPKTLVGQLVSLVDRLDTIAAFFQAGIVPTGSEDPFALRRHAAAVVRIIVEGNLRLGLRNAITHVHSLLQTQGLFVRTPPGGTQLERAAEDEPLEFIAERLRYYGRTVHGLREDVIEAVLQSSRGGPFDLVDCLARMKAIQVVTVRPEFDPLMVGFKRAHGLVEKEKWTRDAIHPSLFQHPTETELYKVLEEAKPRVPALITQGDHAKALDILVQMKPAIDGFFVGVLVNTDDQALRANRLSLLYAVDALFRHYADFSQITVQGT